MCRKEILFLQKLSSPHGRVIEQYFPDNKQNEYENKH